MNRWETDSIDYTDEAALKDALIGRTIVTTSSEGSGFDRVLSYTLDDGTVLKAHATHGGCACSNGCFSVEFGEDLPRATILNVEVTEIVSEYDFETNGFTEKEVTPGSVGDGSAVIRIFVYTELGDRATLVESEGGDNGYYGWGFWLSLHKGEAV